MRARFDTKIRQLLGLDRGPFPDRGVYKGVTYRIDGDAVVMRCSNGKDFLMSPDPKLNADEFDRIRIAAVNKRSSDTGLLPWLEINEQIRLQRSKKPQGQKREIKQSNVDSRSTSSFDSAAYYDITFDEYNKLLKIGPQIMIRYWKSKNKPKM